MLTVQEVPTLQKSSPLAHPAKSLAVILREEFGVPFAFYEVATGKLVLGIPPEDGVQGDDRSGQLATRPLSRDAQPGVTLLPGGRFELAVPFYESGTPVLMGLGVIAALTSSPSDRTQEQGRLQKWVISIVDRLRNQSAVGTRQSFRPGQTESSTNAWDSLLVLDKLFHRLRIHKEPARYQKRILDAAAELLNVQTLVWVSSRNQEPIIGGELSLSPWDCQQLSANLTKAAGWDTTGLLICNEVQQQSWAARCRNVANLLAIDLSEQRAGGRLIALNKRVAVRSRTKPGQRSTSHESPTQDPAERPAEIAPFRREDAALLTPFVSLFGLYTSSAERFNDAQSLLVGLARALTASIDAKDPYTFGHSERVARISAELAKELGLSEDELKDMYLAGLLHDIGKIGIPDAILRKSSPLTPEERGIIEQHPQLGYKILLEVKPISHLLPGVLYHHERYDGAGYPEGLKGEAIPLLARIIAVADSYDAMSSSRPYRIGLSNSRTEEILSEGAGSQWDPLVVAAFLRCRQRVHAIRQRGIGESLRHALDCALRKNDDISEGSSTVSLVAT